MLEHKLDKPARPPLAKGIAAIAKNGGRGHYVHLYIVESVFSPAARPRSCERAQRLLRAGGLKTCWTEPQASTAPQLWALQRGTVSWESGQPAAESGCERLAREPCGAGCVDEVPGRAKLLPEHAMHLRAAMLPRSRNRARMVEMQCQEPGEGHEVSVTGGRIEPRWKTSMMTMRPR